MDKPTQHRATMRKLRKKKGKAAAENSAAAQAPSTANAPATSSQLPVAAASNSTESGAAAQAHVSFPGSGFRKGSSAVASRHPAGTPAAVPFPQAQLLTAKSDTLEADGTHRRRPRGSVGNEGVERVANHDSTTINAFSSESKPRTESSQLRDQRSGSAKKGSSGGSSTRSAGNKGDENSNVEEKGQRRRRLWRFIQWPLVFGVALSAFVAVHRRLIEEAPLTELLQEGLVGPLARLNVSLPPLPRRSLDALIASTGINVSSLFELTDTLTDTLSDITDTLIAGRLTLTGLLPQLPAFNLLPPLGIGGAGDNRSADATGLRPGLAMARRGYRAKHPVVIVPGFVTSGLELWQGLPCGQRYFRQRMWGTLAMVQAFLTDPSCWFRHMELDPVTGLDPAGIKIRAAVGLEAVDYFIQGYWVWGKLVEALADVGYDSNSLVSMPYDWRLAMPLLEERDGYFTRLRLAIEALADISDERVVITAHSYGENVVRSFMTWVEADYPGWVEAHIEAVINIAGTTLGVPKSVSALLSGETRDTAQLGALAGFLTSNLVPRATRTRVWRTWGASYAMLPVGGPRVWGNASWAPDDTPEMRREKRTYGAMVSLWPHDWETVMAAAATAAPQQREELRRLVHNVSETADEPPSSSSQAEPAAAAVPSEDSDGGPGNGDNTGSSSSPMARITDTLKRLVRSGGSEIVAADYLGSEHVTRLDVSGFLALLREVGGRLVDQHMREWAAVDLSGASPTAAEEAGRATRSRMMTAADDDTPQAQQALGGARRLRKAVRRHIALFPDATRTPLPNAPSTAMVCLYGIGLPTERGYHYLRPPPPPVPVWAPGTMQYGPATPGTAGSATRAAAAGDESRMDTGSSVSSDGAEVSGGPAKPAAGGDIVGDCSGGSGGGSRGGGSSDNVITPPPYNTSSSGEESTSGSGPDASSGWMILKDVSDPGTSLDVGVHMSDGDGTVPLLSLGLMCRHGWRPGGPLNPAGMRVVSREFKHRSVSLLQDARGGPATAAHIEILGNEAVLQDVIRVAAGRLSELDDVIYSDIDQIAAAIEF